MRYHPLLMTTLSFSNFAQSSIEIGGRVYATLFNSEGEILCDTSECGIYISGDVWLQSEFYTGITFKF